MSLSDPNGRGLSGDVALYVITSSGHTESITFLFILGGRTPTPSTLGLILVISMRLGELRSAYDGVLYDVNILIIIC